MSQEDAKARLSDTLWQVYHRAPRPEPFNQDSDKFWTTPALAERILHQHLDDTHGAASRPVAERAAQVAWLQDKLRLQPGQHLFDVTCGPGLFAVEFAKRGCRVTGIDFAPLSIAFAADLALTAGVADRCTFIEQDIRHMNFAGATFDAAILLYGQLAVFPPVEAQAILTKIAQTLKPGAHLCLELLNADRVDKTDSAWWFTDDSGLWDDSPYLHLGERFWFSEHEASIERYQIVHLETGELSEVQISDQTYSSERMAGMLSQAGFEEVKTYTDWDGLPLEDASEWVVYVARKAPAHSEGRPQVERLHISQTKLPKISNTTTM
jgi:ubiquinone/menaquinone biosynthesis C-methylase UbiE